MRNRNVRVIFIAAAAVVIICTFFAWLNDPNRYSAPGAITNSVSNGAVIPANAPAGSKLPSSEWLNDFDQFTLRNQKLSEVRSADEKKHQVEIDYLVGLSQRLIRAIPNGLQFDDKLRVFTPIPPPPPSPNVAPSSSANPKVTQ